MKRFPFSNILAVLLLGAIIGCGSSKTGNGDNAGDKSPKSDGIQVADTLKKVALDSLDAVEHGYLADEGRVVIATPAKWVTGSRQRGYLIWFKKPKSLIPHIYVTGEDAAEGANYSLTEENVVAFAESVKQRLVETGQDGKLLEPLIRPMLIGNMPCVRYVISDAFTVQGAVKTEVEKQVLVTVHDGRQYTVALRANDKQELFDNRKAAYAVMAGLQFKGENVENPSN